MTAEACRRKNTWHHFTNGDFFQTFDQQWAFSPRGISRYLMPGFTPSTAQFAHNNIISKEVYRVFVLRCQSTSHLTCLVSSHRVHLLHRIHTVIQLYSRTSFTTIHSYINTLTHSYTTYINSYMVASVT